MSELLCCYFASVKQAFQVSTFKFGLYFCTCIISIIFFRLRYKQINHLLENFSSKLYKQLACTQAQGNYLISWVENWQCALDVKHVESVTGGKRYGWSRKGCIFNKNKKPQWENLFKKGHIKHRKYIICVLSVINWILEWLWLQIGNMYMHITHTIPFVQ